MKKLWFKRKSFGYGWTPNTWQGWLVLVIYTLFAFAGGLYLALSAYFISYMCLITGLLLLVCYKTGEKPRWQWGVSSNKSPNKTLEK
jgi:hypothetical protein